ncbi:zinc-dependent alcohol dehydrogenase [Roseibium album]|uniref:D-arabitol-phosphate dehydrogenase n=1 Tax=Roseibium album TaxID=311410 RepID=A0A0M6Z7L4_9HYPH|nr:alcohol dehydrogenase catalytic domain-containing protein [Roseibium album]CTQ58062.1 D-arabitol-phosphate dehydrogenase [Roseibium album]CTQ67473.1 D-arabitol-phosphate dehydrogenase [Roseibium album]CTQ69990.1 D-arabitol-phosphate dehydrogenase [Roseibium album]
MTMLAAYLVKPGRFELRNVPMPSVGDDQVLVKIARTGICGTDMHIFNGHYAADKLPLIPGHEFTGTVVETGKNVEGTKVGQSVVVDMNIGCGHCYWCRRNEILNCPDMQQMGITINGAFAEFIAVPARLVIAAPDKTPQAVLALTEPLACVVRAARKARITFGQSVVVIGAGPIGNLHVQLLRTIGAAPIIVSDISRDRVRLALEAGADYGVTDPAELEATVMRATEGRGADIVIESVGHPSLYQTAMQLIRKGGHIAAFGLTGAGETLPVDILRTILEENSIKGSVAGMGQDMHDSLTLLTHGRIRTEAFTGATFPLADIQSAFDSLVDRPEDLKTQIVM